MSRLLDRYQLTFAWIMYVLYVALIFQVVGTTK